MSTSPAGTASASPLSRPSLAPRAGVPASVQSGSRAGDELRVHGSATFVDDGGTWRPVPWVAPAVGAASPEATRPHPARPGGCSAASGLLARDDSPKTTPHRRRRARALAAMRLRLGDRFDRPAGHRRRPGGRRVRRRRQPDRRCRLRARPRGGRHPDRRERRQCRSPSRRHRRPGPGPERCRSRCRGRGYPGPGQPLPEPVQILVQPGSPLRGIADLRGKRVELGQPGSGTRRTRRNACWPPPAWRPAILPGSARPAWSTACARSPPARSTQWSRRWRLRPMPCGWPAPTGVLVRHRRRRARQRLGGGEHRPRPGDPRSPAPVGPGLPVGDWWPPRPSSRAGSCRIRQWRP